MNEFYVVGIGPGAFEQMTVKAREVLAAADVIAGYNAYLDLVRPYFPDKEYLGNGMTGEVKRCQAALSQALTGKTVAMISSGDAGIYGMAGLVLELSRDLDLNIITIPGVTAASSGAALLGAPLMHDFAVISLSNRLTDWDLIEKRLRLASEADFSIVLYNPRSKGRPDGLEKARQICLASKKPDTPVGIVKNIGRPGEQALVTTLEKMDVTAVDMFSTVFIGNSKTFAENGLMVTPRGYLEKGAEKA
ncbi:MAG TPA: precorrin-3B C(17)-methyltransferase [Clostridiales bacterium]|nr:precorrin-3B C(17)-methyltransferase [Clostridiales bacterium]